MDIFSLLPILLVIFGLASALNKKGAGSSRRPGNWNPPSYLQPRNSNSTQLRRYPAAGEYTGSDIVKEIDQGKERLWKAASDLWTEVIGGGGSPGTEGTAGIEGMPGTEGSPGSEGTAGAEENWGIEGRPYSEGTTGRFGAEGTPGSQDSMRRSGAEKRLASEGIPGRLGSTEKESVPKDKNDDPFSAIPGSGNILYFPDITEANLRQGVIWAEILGKPKARIRCYARRNYIS